MGRFRIEIFLFLLILGLPFHQTAHSQTRKGSAYFPLQMGDRWVYETSDSVFRDTTSVVDTQTVDGKLYFAVRQNTSYRYLWFRADSDRVYIVDTLAAQLDEAGVSEYMIYDFQADSGRSWAVPITDPDIECEYGGNVTLESKSDTITTFVGLFTGCEYFSRATQCSDAGLFGEWFAAGIGRAAYLEESLTGVREFLLLSSNIVTDIKRRSNPGLPGTPVLLQNYPNPFNPSTLIQFVLARRQFVSLKVYDVLGRDVATLSDGEEAAGAHKVEFDSRGLSSGVYFYRLTTPGYTKVMKMLLVK